MSLAPAPPPPSATRAASADAPFLGWRVVAGAFALAVLGWGLGFYGPPIYLATVVATRGWPVALVSGAVTMHFLVGALVVANLPRLHRRFGLSAVTRAGAVALALGLVGWALATHPWQLFGAACLSGAGWVTMGAAAINAVVSPWFVRGRPKALSTAYNGASVGGIIFSPLWVLLIDVLGFPLAALLVSAVLVATVWALTAAGLGRIPGELGQAPDGDAPDGAMARSTRGVVAAPLPLLAPAAPLPPSPWRDRRFLTLALAMALGLFAQIGLLAHLFSLIAPTLGEGRAGLLMGLATASAIAGRTAFGWLMPPGADRRSAAALSYGVQIAGALLVAFAGADAPALIVAGVLLFGFGIGNATSLPPLIAQAEFAAGDVARVVALIVATGQATYAFAPAVFGLLRTAAAGGGLPVGEGAAVALAAALVMALAIAAFLGGQRPKTG